MCLSFYLPLCVVRLYVSTVSIHLFLSSVSTLYDHNFSRSTMSDVDRYAALSVSEGDAVPVASRSLGNISYAGSKSAFFRAS